VHKFSTGYRARRLRLSRAINPTSLIVSSLVKVDWNYNAVLRLEGMDNRTHLPTQRNIGVEILSALDYNPASGKMRASWIWQEKSDLGSLLKKP
jgi:hypothetical protein